MKKTELIKAAKELNKELGLDPEIEVKKVETDYLIGKLKEAAGMAVKEEDDLSDETWAVLEAMKETVDPPAAGESADKEKETTNTTNTAKDLPAILAETKKLADLKALVEDNDEFKTLRKGLDKYKGLQGPRELRPVMEKCIGVKSDGKKTEKSAGKPAEKKEKKPGVITTIVGLIENSKRTGISKEDILARLKEVFPDREEKSMKNTINVQVPNRITKEKFPVEKTKAGAYRKA